MAPETCDSSNAQLSEETRAARVSPPVERMWKSLARGGAAARQVFSSSSSLLPFVAMPTKEICERRRCEGKRPRHCTPLCFQPPPTCAVVAEWLRRWT
ncbi:hypothetical protein HPB51_003292 [Rhipicephalus microplus]|uniref:Uncharacterized protein n=1 Tax=Rhipicephalus microplus TaxID=6941 RepID=A0A9J6EXV8_RHIMP|nr:hypothetical protein HPB51_003292 [Rhipicephalus microplus]